MRPFSLLIKPASGDCNLRCGYCFYLPRRELFGGGAHRMSREMLETVTRRYLACPMPVHTFGWQGGEPTLMGLDFFRDAVRMQEANARSGMTVANALQTNGTLLDDDWGVFLREKRFLTGISIDGPARLHDRSRLHAGGGGSHREVLRGLGILQRHRAECNVLTLVSAANQDHPVEIYRYLRELGLRFHQYIECVEFDAAGRRRPYALAPGKWGEFLCRLFDEWYVSDTRTISIRLFDSIVSRLATGAPTLCAMSGDCRGYFVVEHNGDVFPCDFHVRPELRLGNVADVDFAQLVDAGLYRDFGAGKRPDDPACGSCRFLALCMGDCPKNRTAGRSALCADWKLFYQHTIDRFERLVAGLAADGAPPEAVVGRNDLCPCGSGKKYKKCCAKPSGAGLS